MNYTQSPDTAVPFSRTLIGSSNSTIKSHNLRAILLTLLRQGQISRVRLAQLTGLSTTTITNLVTELLEQGIVVEEGFEQLPIRRGVGRPRTALRLVPESQYAVGIHIGVGRVRVAATDLLARPVITETLDYSLESPAETVVERACEVVEEALAKSGTPRERLVGVGVGASGLVDIQSGLNIFSPNLGWRDVPLKTWFSQRLGLPTFVDNNVRAMALGEALFGLGRDVYVLAFVYGRIGVGAGFVVGGQLFRGSGAGAGEIGHTTIISNGGEPCRCGNSGCLESLVSEPVILKQARALAAQHPEGILSRYLAQEIGTPISRVLAAARAGDAAARALLEQRAGYMGIALANLVNMLNPDLIVLGGLFAEGADIFLPTVEAVMRQRAFANLGEQVEVQVTGFGQDAGVIGAAALALDTFFYQQRLDV